jgi:hypothetical protein
MSKPIAWGLPNHATGEILDCISPAEHDRMEGGYTVPLYDGPRPTSQPAAAADNAAIINDPETLATQIGFAMRLADAPLSEQQFVTLCMYLKVRSQPE